MKEKVKQGCEREARNALGQNQRYADTDTDQKREEREEHQTLIRD